MKYDPEKQHRRSLRLRTRDYSRDGYYFITICARNRENIFANFCVGARLALAQDLTPSLILTPAGRIVEENWRRITGKNIKTDAFVIMPNHIHGIIFVKPHALGVEAGLAPAPLPDPIPALGDIIGAFISRCSLEYLKFIDDNDLNESAKIWQRNYYERVIRNKEELIAVRKYITSNPAHWLEDEENPLNF
jgi:putative transposase